MYMASCVRSLEAAYHTRMEIECLNDALLDRFTDLFADMHSLNKTAAEVHLLGMTNSDVPWSMLHTSRTCLHCLRQKPKHVLTCGHTVCDACIQVYGDQLAHAE